MDSEFRQIHETSPMARGSYQVARPSIEATSRMAAEAGLPQPDRVVASSERSRLMIFSVDSPNASPPGLRILGLTTQPTVTVEDAVRFVQPLL